MFDLLPIDPAFLWGAAGIVGTKGIDYLAHRRRDKNRKDELQSRMEFDQQRLVSREASDLRAEYVAQIAALQTRVERLEHDLEKERERNYALLTENLALRANIDHLKLEILNLSDEKRAGRRKTDPVVDGE